MPGTAGPATETNKRALREVCDVPVLFDVADGQQTIELAVA
jgi:hypothetical protein